MKLKRELYVDEDKNIVRVTKEIMTPLEYLLENQDVLKFASDMGLLRTLSPAGEINKKEQLLIPAPEDIEP